MEDRCPDGGHWLAQVSALVDGEDLAVDAAALRAHLDGCAACSAWLEHARRVNAGLHELPVLSPDLGERVVDAVDVHLCGCRAGAVCLCGNCQCGPGCTCRTAS